jgi:hypothetical protein
MPEVPGVDSPFGNDFWHRYLQRQLAANRSRRRPAPRKSSRGGPPPSRDAQTGAGTPPAVDRPEADADADVAAASPGPNDGDEISPTSVRDEAKGPDSPLPAGAVFVPQSLQDTEASLWTGSETTVVALRLLDNPERARSDDDGWREVSVIRPSLVEDGHTADRGPEPGRWLPLRDAVRAVGSLERLNRLAKDGMLQTREGADGEVEVWVAERDSYRASSSPFEVEADAQAEATGVPEPGTSEVSNAEAGLIEALAEAHERQITLAQENGTLRERLAILEHELGELRVQAAGSLGPLTQSHERHLELIRENGALDARVVALERALEDARTQAAGSQASLAKAHEHQLEVARENGALTERVAMLERAQHDASVAAASQSAAKESVIAARMPLLMMVLAVIIIVALGTGWLAAHLS